MKRIKIYALLLIGVALITTGFRCTFITAKQQELLQPVELTWWGTFDDPNNFTDVIKEYQVVHPNIKVTYRKLRTEEFDTELIHALAEDRGPDIVSINNKELNKWMNNLEPLPATTKMAYTVKQKSLGIKEETLVEIRETTSITPAKIKEQYLDVVSDDVIVNGKVYGLPLSVNTLVLFYNRDLFNNANLALPPTTWTELQTDVKKLTFQDKENKLVQSGIAMGLSENIEYSPDILSLLMMQNGAQMTDGNRVMFTFVPPGGDKLYNPGPEAVRFYTDFADPVKEVYTWDKTFANSLDAFAQGKVAMIFGYGYDVSYIEGKRQGKLNYAIARVPQIEGRKEVNVANYWFQTVTKKSKHINESWDFIQFISKADVAKKYLNRTLRPTALRTLVDEQIQNDQLNIFASQLLTSENWYHGRDTTVMEQAFKEMITSVHQGIEVQKAIDLAAQKVQQTL
ncbi:MAG: extracellular solute-binding protein [Patescibacteria group bacterium]|nr:extracellular solute-binding protein [Patescibacteria group bacterium]